MSKRVITTEADVRNYFTEQCVLHDVFKVKLNATNMVGLPDWMCFMKFGHVAFAELKSPTGKLQVHQVRMHVFLTSIGFPVYVLSNKEEVDHFISIWGKK